MVDDHGTSSPSPREVPGDDDPTYKDGSFDAHVEIEIEDEVDDADDLPVLAPVDPGPVVPALETWLPLLTDRSTNPTVCPFLRSIDGDGFVGVPIEAVDASNRCAALREVMPQSLRQQQLVCLTASHVDCPRYQRGAVVLTQPTTSVARARSPLSPAILASIVVLIAAFSASVAFVLARGSLELDEVAVASAAPSSTTQAAASPASTEIAVATVTPDPTPSLTPAPTPSPSPTPSPAATPSPTPEPTPEATPEPEPTSDRYELLRPCRARDDCWVYVVRRGDNLFSIANYFGVELQDVYRLNPRTREQGIRAGQSLRLPPPTR